MRTQVSATIALIAALIGLFFAGVATSDFASHLDRQMHDIHCSFVPGLVESSPASTGCQVTMMSPYSSVLRTSYWGGIPISLPAMSVFAFLAFFAVYMLITKAHEERRSAGFYALAWGLPVLASLGMGFLSLVTLGAACKLCIGIYISSFVGFGAALMGYRRASRELPSYVTPGAADATIPDHTVAEHGATHAARSLPRVREARSVGWAFVLGVVFVFLPVGGYVAAMPSYEAFHGGCGELVDASDRYDVLVPVGGVTGGRPAIEVLDPLCPSCAAFEQRLAASGLQNELSRKALLFPLDASCNWMVPSSIHPGACSVSEAILCEPASVDAILAWSFEHQDEIIAAERANPGSAAQMVTAQFPSTRGCVGSKRIESRLHRGLRWAVANELPVLTPQLFVEGRKLCNEDTDLGLDYSLARLLEHGAAQ